MTRTQTFNQEEYQATLEELAKVGKGTKLYKRLQKEGRLREDTLGDNTHRFRFNFQPEMDETILINGYSFIGLLDSGSDAIVIPLDVAEALSLKEEDKWQIKNHRSIRLHLFRIVYRIKGETIIINCFDHRKSAYD